MKVDRIGTLYNSPIYTRYLRGLHIENVIHSRKTSEQRALCELRQTAAVSRCVSDLHGKKYRILEIYPFAARKPVGTCPRGLQGQR